MEGLYWSSRFVIGLLFWVNERGSPRVAAGALCSNCNYPTYSDQVYTKCVSKYPLFLLSKQHINSVKSVFKLNLQQLASVFVSEISIILSIRITEIASTTTHHRIVTNYCSFQYTQLTLIHIAWTIWHYNISLYY